MGLNTLTTSHPQLSSHLDQRRRNRPFEAGDAHCPFAQEPLWENAVGSTTGGFVGVVAEVVDTVAHVVQFAAFRARNRSPRRAEATEGRKHRAATDAARMRREYMGVLSENRGLNRANRLHPLTGVLSGDKPRIAKAFVRLRTLRAGV